MTRSGSSLLPTTSTCSWWTPSSAIRARHRRRASSWSSVAPITPSRSCRRQGSAPTRRWRPGRGARIGSTTAMRSGCAPGMPAWLAWERWPLGSTGMTLRPRPMTDGWPSPRSTATPCRTSGSTTCSTTRWSPPGRRPAPIPSSSAATPSGTSRNKRVRASAWAGPRRPREECSPTA